LIEVLAAVFLMTVAIAFFVELTDSTDAATLKAREGRLALAIGDRIARDLEGAYMLTKPPELDPLQHPWFFVAQNEYDDPGADRLRFVTRNHRPRNPLDHGSDVAVVSYLLQPSEDGPGFELLRAVEPGTPQELGEFLPADDERYMLVAENIEHFALRLLGDDLEWFDVWDSSQLEQSSKLPRAADIEIAFLPEQSLAEDFDDFGRLAAQFEERLPYTRRVVLPVRPVDLQAMLTAAAEAAAGQQPGQQQDPDVDAPEDGEDDDPFDAGADDAGRARTVPRTFGGLP
jgi:hypothetical protein